MSEKTLTIETPDDFLEFHLPITQAPKRLDKVLAELLPEHSRSRLQQWVTQGAVLVNGQPAKTKQLVGPADRLIVFPQVSPQDLAFQPQDIPLEIVGESDQWIVVNKPAGLVTHPGAGNWTGTLLNGLLYRYPELAHVARAGIVHRLDKDTSGLLVVARTEVAQTQLVRQLQARTVHREYVALVKGVTLKEGLVDMPIGRDPKVPVKMGVLHPIAPKEARTHYMCVRQGQTPQDQAVSQVVCRLETGRTHQIRVHLSSLGHPLIGDTLYGGPLWLGATRQMLHAQKLMFNDPVTGQLHGFEAPIPSDMQAVLDAVRWNT